MESGAVEFSLVAVASIIILAPFITKLVDFIRNAVDVSNNAPSWIWNLSSIVLSLVVALVFQVNVFLVASPTKVSNILGQVLTGFAMAGWSAGFHEIFAKWSAQSKSIETHTH